MSSASPASRAAASGARNKRNTPGTRNPRNTRTARSTATPDPARPRDTTLASRRIGFVGLGDIGLPMVANLLRAGAEVWVNDLRPQAVRRATALGARGATLAEMAQHCPVICVAVINERQLREVELGAGGLLDAPLPKAAPTLIVHSRVPPKAVRELAATVAKRKVRLLDAPMSGANIAARAGTLSFLVGGSKAVVRDCKPCLEALRLAAAYDVAEEDIVPLVRQSTGDNWTIRNWGYFDRFLQEHTLAGKPELIEGLLHKDIADALIAGHDAQSSLPMSGLAMELYPQLMRERLARRAAGKRSRQDKRTA